MSDEIVKTTEYDKSYIKNPIDIDGILEGYMRSHENDNTGLHGDDKDDELADYISRINSLAEKYPDKAVDPKDFKSDDMADTKEIYRLSSLKTEGKKRQVRDIKPEKSNVDEIKFTGKKARIASVKEFVQTAFPGIDPAIADNDNKIFVVTMQEDKKREESKDTAELEKIVADDGEINQEELERVLKDDMFAVISGKIRAIKEEYSQKNHPFDKISDKNEIRNILSSRIAKGRKSLILIGTLFLLLAYLAITQTTDALPFFRAVSYVHGNRWFMLINAALMLPILISAKDIYKTAAKQIICMSLGIETAITAFLSLSFIHTLILALIHSDKLYTYVSLAVMVLYGYVHFETEKYKKLRADYKLLAFKPTKTCGEILQDKQLVSDIAGENTSAASVRKYDTVNTDGFFTKSLKRAAESKLLSIMSIISLAVSFTIFVVYWVMNASFTEAFSMLVLALALTVSVVICVTNSLPYLSFSKKLKFSGAAITGEDTAKNFAKAETLILSDSDLFPPRSLLLCGSKRYNDSDMKSIIVDVASVLSAVDSPLTSMMIDVISGQTELLKEPDSVTYYDEKGLSAYVENSKVLIGNRAFMRDNLIKIPADGTKEKVESVGNIALFVAVNGFLAAVLSVKYNENQIIKRRIKKLVSSGVGFALKSKDPNLTKSFVCTKYDIPESMLRILPASLSEREEEAKNSDNTPDVITITKDVTAFFRAHTTAHKMRTAITVNTVIGVIAYLFGVLLATAVCAMGMLTAAKPILVILLQLFWVAPSVIVTAALNRTI